MHISLKTILVLSILVLSCAAQAEPQVSPALIQQFKAMSPGEQSAIAKQYGFELPKAAKDNVMETLAKPPEALTQSEKKIEAQVEQSKSKNVLERFGRSLFQKSVSTFAPTDNALVPNDYRIGVGDELVVQLFGKDNSLTSLQVGRDGVINFPKLGPISVAGLSFDEAQSLVRTRVATQFIGVDAVVSMGRLRAMNIFMAGEVSVPGAYSVSALTTITQALFQAGGVTDIGSLRNIQVKRGGKLVATFDVYDLLLKGDISNDIRLQSGDVVFVPPYKRLVTVMGEVKRPMVYEVVDDELLGDMIEMSGGYKSSAFAGELVIIKKREAGELPEVLNIRAGDEQSLRMPMSNGDVVRVLPLGDNVENNISMEGALSRPGTFGWKPGLRVSDLISDARRDLQADADVNYSLIVREVGDNLDVEVLQFRLADVLTRAGTEGDPLLKARDRVLVFSVETTTQINEELQAVDLEDSNRRSVMLKPLIEKLRAQAVSGKPSLIATISGAVKAPADYPLGSSFTVSDLLSAAGGTDDSAFIQQIEVRRMQELANGNMRAEVLNIAFDEIGDFVLKPMDFVTVKRKANWGVQEKVSLKGEVLYPGDYILMPGETLKDLLQRAGGFTREAFVEGAIFTRLTVKALEEQQARKFAADIKRSLASSMITQEQSKASELSAMNEVINTLSDYEGKGRLVIDLKRALIGDAAANLEMQEGDVLMIPKRPHSIAVVGEVRQPGAHLFDGELSLADYLSLSAGTTARSDDENVYVVRASGAVVRPEGSLTRFVRADVRLQPGDTIVVPVNTGYQDDLPFWRDVTQVIYQGVVTIAAISNLGM